MAERQTIPYVEIPKKWINSHAVICQDNTRWYVERGRFHNLPHWMRELNTWVTEQTGGLLLPLQWVPGYVNVSRAAVQKRAKTGGLTVFSYIVTDQAPTLLGKLAHLDVRRNYDLVPYSECDAWRRILQDIAYAREEFDSK